MQSEAGCSRRTISIGTLGYTTRLSSIGSSSQKKTPPVLFVPPTDRTRSPGNPGGSREKIGQSRQEYNEFRPRSNLNDLTPDEFAAPSGGLETQPIAGSD